MYLVLAPRYTTSRTCPDAEHSSDPTVAPGSLSAIFSGRIVNACSSPLICRATEPSRTFDTPTNPATKPVAGAS